MSIRDQFKLPLGGKTKHKIKIKNTPGANAFSPYPAQPSIPSIRFVVSLGENAAHRNMYAKKETVKDRKPASQTQSVQPTYPGWGVKGMRKQTKTTSLCERTENKS